MAFEVFSYDPLTGVRTLFDYDDDTDTAIFRREQDIEPLLNHAARMRANAPKSVLGRPDEEWMLEAMIPNVVQMDLLKKGLDLGNPDHAEAIAREIEVNYKYLKCTDLKIWRPT